jgi:hypothetical protein
MCIKRGLTPSPTCLPGQGGIQRKVLWDAVQGIVLNKEAGFLPF